MGNRLWRRSSRRIYATALHGAVIGYAATQLTLGGIFDVFPSVWHWASDVGDKIYTFVGEAIDRAKDFVWTNFVKPLWDSLGDVINMAVSLTTDIWNWIHPVIDQIWGGIKQIGLDVWHQAEAAILWWVGQLKGMIDGVYNTAGKLIGDLTARLDGFASIIFHTLIEPVYQAITKAVGDIWNNWLVPFILQFQDLVRNIWDHIRPYVEPILGQVTDLYRQLTEIWDFVNKLKDKLWPFVSDPIGWINDQLHKAIRDNTGGFADAMIHAISTNMNHIEDLVAGWLE